MKLEISTDQGRQDSTGLDAILGRAAHLTAGRNQQQIMVFIRQTGDIDHQVGQTKMLHAFSPAVFEKTTEKSILAKFSHITERS